ncbi:protein translocase subunit SecF [Auraticoccus monumenti]|uniref:Protein-export membrane protein SecF n=1 Tax=Auraticoccus monumenti TaxID=675864 RepID=A0A1G7B829_9ACTN|nr:protein translocase subunit SecF [Auraticoccus monumenti]SDE23278.1 protein translocase subunit secF [Auraticoccus monumenti]
MRDFIRRLNTGTLAYDFLGRWRRWFVITAVVLLLSVLGLVVRPLNLGIEFRGGADFQAATAVQESTVDDMRGAMEATALPDFDGTTVTTIGDSTVRVQTRALSVDEVSQVRQAIAQEVGVGSEEVAYSLIGASWGDQITERALLALGIFLVLVMLVIWIYFKDWKMSVAAMAALLHDLVVTVGVYAWSGFTVTPATVIGILTILGYSLYDTVVVFDKVRENVAGLREQRRTYTEAANAALNAVLVRSLNTTIIGVLPVVALLIAGAGVLGQGPLKDLALALFVGMVAGAYSSIFLAAVVLAKLKEREPGMVEHRRNVERRLAKTPAPAAGKRTTSGGGRAATSLAVLEREAASDDEPAAEPTGPEIAVEEAGSATTRWQQPSDPRTSVLSEGAAKRPQPRREPRSRRRKP